MVVIKSRLIRTIVDNYQHVLPTWMIAVTVYVDMSLFLYMYGEMLFYA